MHGDCYCLKTFRDGDFRGAANVNVVRCSRLAAVIKELGDENLVDLRCHASVPLSAGDRPLGMLNLASNDLRVLTADELNLLTTAGSLMSLIIERSRLEASGSRAVAAEERNRIAREIHDTLAQGLAALTLQLEVADALAMRSENPELRDSVSRALNVARNTLEEARRSVLDLRASPLEGRTLSQALQQLATEIRRDAHDILVDVDCHGFHADSPGLTPAVEIGLFRIAQQALANILRHSAASHARVRLASVGALVRLQIEDNGSGFDPDHVPPDRFGLVGMGERARLLGGSMTIETSAGVGTVVTVEIPAKRPASAG
jgi:two-component system NarL family sensor kinase